MRAIWPRVCFIGGFQFNAIGRLSASASIATFRIRGNFCNTLAKAISSTPRRIFELAAQVGHPRRIVEEKNSRYGEEEARHCQRSPSATRPDMQFPVQSLRHRFAPPVQERRVRLQMAER